MATTINTTKALVRDAIRSRVYIADRLGKQWREVVGLYCDELKLSAAPAIDTATLHYDYGPMRREAADSPLLIEEPLDLLGKFVKVVLEAARADGSDLLWYGLIEIDDNIPMGSGEREDLPRGAQRFTAYGLLRMLERVFILSTVVDYSQNATVPVDKVTLEQGLQFNHHDQRKATWQGNRTQYREYGNPNLPFRFSDKRSSEHLWTAFEAAEYLLIHHAPQDGNGDDVCAWKLATGSELILAWYEPQVRTDGRTVKQVIDELIPHRKGMGYRVDFNEEQGSQGTATITPFSFASEDVVLQDFKVLAANENPRTLNFENALDVEARIVETVTSAYDRVTAIGHFATSTCTLSFDPLAFQFWRDWTDTAFNEYLQGASGDADYNTLSPINKMSRNTRYRQRDKLRAVFRRWKLYPWWDGLTWDHETPRASATLYYVNPPWPEVAGVDQRDRDPNADPIQPYNSTTQEPGLDISPNHLWIERGLPLNDRCDYSDDRIITHAWEDDLSDTEEPTKLTALFFARVDPNSTPKRYELLERLSDQASNESVRRRWSAQGHVLSDQAAVELNVHGAPQHFLSPLHAGGMADTENFLDASKETGLQYDEIRATVCLRLPWRVQQSVDITEEFTPGKQFRTLYLPVEAMLDYVVPDTVVEIKNGRPITTDGGFVRDDRIKLNDIAHAAAQWYGTKRQTLFFRLAGVLHLVDIGDLIENIGGRYTLEGVNTPVTTIRYDLARQTTEWETTFAEVEFA